MHKPVKPVAACQDCKDCTLPNGITKLGKEVADQLSQSPTTVEPEKSPNISEVEGAISILCEGKSFEPDGIHYDIPKGEGSKLVEVLHDILTEAWNKTFSKRANVKHLAAIATYPYCPFQKTCFLATC